MAILYPDKLPGEVLKDPKRSAEIKVYKALRDQLDDQFHVYYSSPWLGTRPDGSEVEGEADFVVAHSEKGVLTVEVKGGIVEIDKDGLWASTDRHRIRRRIKNPVAQARTCKHQILKQLQQSNLWKTRFISVSHGVVLPDSAKPSKDFRPDMPLKLFAFDEDMRFLDHWVDSRMLIGDREYKPLGEDGLYALRSIRTDPVRLRVRLGTHIEDDLNAIRYRTDDQLSLIHI